MTPKGPTFCFVSVFCTALTNSPAPPKISVPFVASPIVSRGRNGGASACGAMSGVAAVVVVGSSSGWCGLLKVGRVLEGQRRQFSQLITDKVSRQRCGGKLHSLMSVVGTARGAIRIVGGGEWGDGGGWSKLRRFQPSWPG